MISASGYAGSSRRSTAPRQLWTAAGIEYHAARVRLAVAHGLLAAGDSTGAAAELAAVRLTAARIGSRRLADAAEALDQLEKDQRTISTR